MIIYFADRDLNILGHASTSLPAGYRIKEDNTVEDVETGVNTFQCAITYTYDTRATLEDAVQVGRFILKQSNTSDSSNIYDSVYQIIETEFDTQTQTLTLYAEDAGLDLLNTMRPAVTLSGTVTTMMQYFLPSDWSLNMMDVPTNTRSYTWDGASTTTERLLSVANLFGCELYYSFIIDRLEITSKVVNVTPKRGNQTAIPQLRLNYDVDRIYTKKSITNLVTAFDVTGGTPDGADTPINLKGYTYSYTDPNTGDLYQVDTASGQMRNKTAMARWASAIDQDGLWVGEYSFDTTDKAVLAGQARAQLQKESQIQVNYEVDFVHLPEDIQVGDRVNIIDEQGELYLEARLLRIETSVAEDKRTAVIGEYIIRDSGISEKVSQMASDLANARATDRLIQEQMQVITDTVGAMFTLEVDSDVLFSVAHLEARLLNGDKDVKADYDPNWFKWVWRSENGEKLLGRGYTIDVDMDIIGYASTILCKFIRPELYDLTDHNLTAITDANSDPIQVAFAGIYNQPVATRNLRRSSLKALRATQETGTPTLNREVNLYEKDAMRRFTQHFWTEETGEHAGAHITEVGKDEFLNDPQNGGGNLLARSDGIAVRDGLEELAVFGADGMRIGKTNEKHIEVTSTSFRVHDEDGSVPFAVDTSNSQRTQTVTRTNVTSGTSGVYPTWYTQIYLRGSVEENKIYFGVSSSGNPATFTDYIIIGATSSINVGGVYCTATRTGASTVTVTMTNTNITSRYVACQWTETYYETSVKVNDAVLDRGYGRVAMVDSVGTSIGDYCYVITYGKLAMLQIAVYNTNSIAVGGRIYAGNLLNYIPETGAMLVGEHLSNKVIVGRVDFDGGIHVDNTWTSAFSTSSSSYINLYATYIYK